MPAKFRSEPSFSHVNSRRHSTASFSDQDDEDAGEGRGGGLQLTACARGEGRSMWMNAG